MRSALTIAFDYRPSRRIACAAAAIACAAVVAPWLSGLPVVARIALSIAAAAAGFCGLKRFLQPPLRRVAFRAAGWMLVDAAGAEHAAELMSHARLGAWLVLDFRIAADRRVRAWLGPDNADAETRRRLIVLLARAEVAQAG